MRGPRSRSPGALDTRLRTRALLLLAHSGHSTLATEAVLREQALTEAGDDPELRSIVLTDIAIETGIGEVHGIAQCEGLAQEAVDLAISAGEQRQELRALHSLIWMRSLRGKQIGAQLRQADRIGGAIRSLIFESIERHRAVRMLWRGELAPAREILVGLLAAAEERGEDISYFVVRLHLCELSLRSGDWELIDQLLEDWERHPAESVGSSPAFLRISAQLSAGRGDPAAREQAEQAVSLALETGGAWHRLEALRALGMARMIEGDYAGSADSLTEAWTHLVENGVLDPGAFPLATELVEALVRSGRRGTAQRVSDELAKRSGDQDHPWGLAAAAACRGRILLAAGDAPSAVCELESAAAAFGEMGCRLDRGRTLAELGSALRRSRRIGAAREALVGAIRGLEDMQSGPWAARPREELSRVGGRTRSGGLTPTEIAVAELVARGRANKEVASELVVSVSAVERHLTRIYAKLGIRSRTELAGRFFAHRDQSVG